VKRSLALVYVAGLFLFGILIGALGMHLYYAQRFPGPRPGGGPPHQRGMGPFFVERLERDLELTPEQIGRIEEIVHESRIEFEGLRREMRPRLRDQMDRTTERIAEVLTPEQREKFERLRGRPDRRMERFFLGR